MVINNSMAEAVKDVLRELKRVREKGSFAQNISIVFSGNFINLILQFLFAPILSRIYGPEAYGEYAYYNLIISNIAFFAAISLPTVFVLPKARLEFLALAKVVICSQLVLTGISLLVFLLLNGRVIEFPVTYLAIPVIILLLFLTGINSTLSSWNIREKRFARNTATGMTSQLFAKGSALGVGYFWIPSGLGLLLGDLIKGIVAFLTMTRVKLHLVLFRFLMKDNWKFVFETLKKNINVPKYIFPSQLLNKWTTDLPIIIIGSYYSKVELGLYIFAVSMLAIPKDLIANTLQPVFLQKANYQYSLSSESLFTFMARIYPLMILAIILPITLLTVIAPELFRFVFGEHWAESGAIVQLISTQYTLSIILGPFVSLRRILKHEKRIFILNVISVSFKIIPLAILWFNPTLEDFLVWYSTSIAAYLFLNFTELVLSTTKRLDAIQIILFCFLSLLLSYLLIHYLS